jgi:hypothetical protein
MRGRHLKAEIKAVAAWRETRKGPEKDTFKSRLQEMNLRMFYRYCSTFDILFFVHVQ